MKPISVDDQDLIDEARTADESNSFVRSCAAYLKKTGRLTDKQRQSLEAIIEEAWSMTDW